MVADDGFPGTVVRVLTAGSRSASADGRVELTVQAGEQWEPFVARCVAEGLAGVESLSGIPGSIGATPIQNVGAYGQEVAETIVSVRVLDRERDVVEELARRPTAASPTARARSSARPAAGSCSRSPSRSSGASCRRR